MDLPVEALVSTQFVEWSSKSFQQPIFNTIYEEVSTSTRNSLVDGASPFTRAKPTDWALHTYEGLKQKAQSDVDLLKSQKIRSDIQHVNVSVNRPQTSMVWSVLRPYLFTCDGERVSIFSSDKISGQSTLRGTFNASTEAITGDRISDLMVTNELTHELIVTGSRNGVIKVWDPMFHEHGHEIKAPPKLITAADIMKGTTRIKMGKDSNLNSTLYRWDQTCGRLVCTGNVRVLRIWDSWSEKLERDINLRTKNDIVASLAVNMKSNMISCGKMFLQY